jgi:hypothetical protein
MAEFQWWLLIVGLVAGGGLVAVVQMDARRREEDVEGLERRAEATWIAERLSHRDRELDARTVESILRVHREYLALPPPDRLIVEGDEPSDGTTSDASSSDADPDRVTDDVRDDRSGGPDEDLPRAGEEQPTSGEEADAGADREQRGD